MLRRSAWIASAFALVLACHDDKTMSDPSLDAAVGRNDGGTRPRDAAMVLDAGADGGEPAKDAQTPRTKARVVSVAPPYTIAEDGYKYAPKTSEPTDGSWKVKDGPEGMGVDADGVTIAWTATKQQAGEHEVTLEAKVKSQSQTVSQTLTVTVATSEKRAETEVTTKRGGTAAVTAPASKIKGAGVSVGPGAVREGKTVTVSELDVSPKLPSAKGKSTAVRFGQTGLVFDRPALVALPLPSDVVLDPERLGAFVYTATAG